MATKTTRAIAPFPKHWSRTFCTPVVLLLAYVISGKLALLLALPPGYASAIFPPAGIAVAAALICGRRALPGVFLGALLLNLWVGYSPATPYSLESLAAALAIAIASALQAAAGGEWLRRAVGYPSAFDRASDISRFLLLSPAICLISASLSVACLTLLGIMEGSDFATNWLTWWLGDTLGLIVMLPLVLVVAGEPRQLWRNREFSVAVPMLLAFALFVFVFIKANHWEQDESLVEFRAQAQRMADQMQNHFNEQEFLLEELSGLYSHNPERPVTREEFRRFVGRILKRFPNVQAIDWAPRVEQRQRAAFEAAQQASLPAYEIREKAASKGLGRASERPFYYPVTYIEPDNALNHGVLGYDLASDTTRLAALNGAWNSDTAVATAPVRLVSETSERNDKFGILLIQAITKGSGPGVVLTAVRINDFFERSPAYQRTTTLVRLTDMGSQEAIFDTIEDRERAADFEQILNFGSRSYRLEFAPTRHYLMAHRGWQSWTVLAVGLFGTGLLGALLMLSTGYTARVERNVDAHVAELRENSEKLQGLFELSPLGIVLTDMQGHFIEFNQAFLHISGYSEDELRKLDYWHLTPRSYEADEARQLALIATVGRYGPYEKEYIRKDGSRVPLNFNGLLLTGRNGEKYIWSIVEDISGRRQVEQSLRESEERWKFALEGSGDGVWDWNLQTGELFLSRQEMSVLGYEGDEACHTRLEPWVERQHPQDRETRGLALENYLAGRTPFYTYDFRTLCRNGQWRWIRARGILVAHTPDGQPLRMIGTHTNIDASRRQAERETVHSAVMEMLAWGGKLNDVLARITASLEDENSDLAFAAFIVREEHSQLAVGSAFTEAQQNRRCHIAGQANLGGQTIFMGERLDIRMDDSPYWRDITTLAAEAGLEACWSEPIFSQEEGIEGTLVAFRRHPGSNAVPDLETQRHAARLMSIAIQRKRIENQLLLASSVYEASSEGIMVVDSQNRIVAINPAFTKITGYDKLEVLGRDPRLLKSNEHDPDFYRAMWRAIIDTGAWQGEIWNRRQDGSSYPVWMTINTIRGDGGEVIHRACIFSDITDKKLAEERIHHLARHDVLTGLPNRMLYMDRLNQAIATARREQSLMALVYIDLDNFKPVNDTLGHQIGDELLQQVAERMLKCVRESDTVARIGGDEFVVLLPAIKDEADSIIVAEKIRTALARRFRVAGHPLAISSSIGIAVYPAHGKDAQELAVHADAAMYLAKRAGRNTVRVYDDMPPANPLPSSPQPS
jgi:diguanylate cyclase (GGDEF)-like protein/PAS domain S-box-containing protein